MSSRGRAPDAFNRPSGYLHFTFQRSTLLLYFWVLINRRSESYHRRVRVNRVVIIPNFLLLLVMSQLSRAKGQRIQTLALLANESWGWRLLIFILRVNERIGFCAGVVVPIPFCRFDVKTLDLPTSLRTSNSWFILCVSVGLRITFVWYEWMISKMTYTNFKA